MTYRSRSGPLWLLLLFVSLTAPLSATTIYVDWADWQAGVSSFEAVDFEGLTTDYASYPTGLTQGNAQFTGEVPDGSGQLWVIDPVAHPSHDFGTGAVLKGPVYSSAEPGREIKVSLPADTTAFALELMTVGSSPETFTVMLSTGESWNDVLTATGMTPQFFGISTDVPFAEVHLLLSTGVNSLTFPVIDNIAYGITGVGGAGDPLEGGAETPEAATLLLIGTGLLLIWRMAKRESRRNPATA